MDKRVIYVLRVLMVLNILLLVGFIAVFYTNIGNAGLLADEQRLAVSGLRAEGPAARPLAYSRIMDFSAEFYVKETPFAAIRYTEADAVFVPAINGIVNVFYPLLIEDFGLTFEDTGRLSIVVFPDQPSLEAALGRTYSYIPTGVFFAGVINILSPTAWAAGSTEQIAERFTREGPLIHEMVHFVFNIRTNGNYPLWFTEGVALFYEYKYSAFEWRPDLRYAAARLCANEVAAYFRNFCVMLSYRKAFDIVARFVETYGEDGLQAVIAELGNGTPYPVALAPVLEHYSIVLRGL